MADPGNRPRDSRARALSGARRGTPASASRRSTEFVAYVRAHEPGTLRYEVWQERDVPTRFVHLFIFRDAAAQRRHSESAEVKRFASILYPECLAPVEFVDYREIASNLR